jgi:hypothetical protein
MTKKEGILLASRALSVYLLCWALSDMSYLPQYLLSIGHHSFALIGHEYWSTYYFLGFAFHVVRIIALFAAASWFYHCGVRVEEFFFPSEEPGASTKTDT